MAYSSEVYSAARRILEERRTNAQRLAELKKADVYAKIPEIKELDSELSRNMANFSMLILRGNENFDSVLKKMNAQSDLAKSKKTELLTKNGFSFSGTLYNKFNFISAGSRNNGA